MSSRFPKIYRLIVVLADFATVLVAFFAGIYVRNLFLEGEFSYVAYFEFPTLFLYVVLIWWTVLLVFDAGEKWRFRSIRKEFLIGVWATVIGLALLFAIGFLSKVYYPRSIIISFSLCFLCLWGIQKSIGYQISTVVRKGRRASVLVVGAGNRAVEFCDQLLKYKATPYQVVGFLDAREEAIGRKINGDRHVIGSFGQLAEILKTYLVEEVFFALEPRHFGYLDMLLEVCSDAGITSHLIYTSGKTNPYRAFPDSIGEEYPCISFSRLPQEEAGLFVKRVMDVTVSALSLAVLSPLFLVIAILIKLTSKGPVFFPWKVVGTGNRDFIGYKFRTMVENAEELKTSLSSRNEMNGPVFKIKDDPRITPVGKWLRKFSLDELPQLWSVLKGDMSLVGPRPPNRNELSRYEFWQRRKISFKPGITCLWQAGGRNRISDFNEWCRLDLEYIDNWSLWLDFKILVRTVWAVVRGTGM